MTLMPTFTSIQASSCCALLSSHQSLVPHSENHLLLFKSCSTASTRPAPELCEQLLGPHPSHPCCPVPQPAPKNLSQYLQSCPCMLLTSPLLPRPSSVTANCIPLTATFATTHECPLSSLYCSFKHVTHLKSPILHIPH